MLKSNGRNPSGVTHNRGNVCMLTRRLSLFGCLAAVSVTPLGCGQTLQMTQSCCSTGRDALHLSVSLSLSHTHTPSPAFLLCTLTVRSSASVFLCTCADLRKFTEQQTGAKKNDGVFCFQVPGLHASCACLCVWAQMCVGVHASQFLFLMSALCWDGKIIWADFCPGCSTQT